MRYFRYQNTDKVRNNALKEQYKTLMENKERVLQWKKCWTTISTIVTFAVFCTWGTGVIFLLNTIFQPQNGWLKVPVLICQGILGLALFLVGGVVTAHLTGPFWKKTGSFHIPRMKQEILSKACGDLRDYYGLQEPYIITKCFDASDRKFRNRDVCIFVVGDELRITTDLVHGFLDGKRDLGCYAFKQEEITLSKQKNGDHLIAELKAENTVFLLGYRAKGFIDKNFLK